MTYNKIIENGGEHYLIQGKPGETELYMARKIKNLLECERERIEI